MLVAVFFEALKLKALNDFLYQFEQALNSGDWEAIAELQARLTAVVEESSATVQTLEQQQQFAEGLTRLHELVQSAVSQATEAKSAVADQLRKLSKGREAAAQYNENSGD
jgi:predicted HAD superfamily Cof-like phosphohydrolase